MKAVEIFNLSKSFTKSKRALCGIDLSVEQGEMVALIGASGSGKSTLLRHVAGLLQSDRNPDGSPSSRITVFGKTIQSNGRLAGDARNIRCGIGVIFQQFNLVPRLRVLTNVLIGNLGTMGFVRSTLWLFNKKQKLAAMRALQRVGIAEQAMQRGTELSGGQQQRAAIARTLVQKAQLIVADEPIASLDPSAARRVMDTLYDLNQRDGITVMISLHQVEYALSYCKRTIALRDGYLLYDGPSAAITPQFLNELYGEESEDLLLPNLRSPPGLGQQNSTTESSASARRERQPKARQFADSLETTPAT
ncbi:MAG: phosphonate transport system ATP-binding protein [Gammaproteobacteria bacterium]|jgi:phosphonate transport system ATP-binding protein